jgi:hypothetical protein
MWASKPTGPGGVPLPQPALWIGPGGPGPDYHYAGGSQGGSCSVQLGLNGEGRRLRVAPAPWSLARNRGERGKWGRRRRARTRPSHPPSSLLLHPRDPPTLQGV